MKKIKKIQSLAVAVFLVALPVYANDAGSGMYSWYNAFWGSQKDRNAIATCDTDTLDASIAGGNNPTYVPNGGIGIVNNANLLFCHLENTLGISGVTDAAGITGSFQFGSDMYFHAVVTGSTGGNAQSDGTNPDSYDFQAQIWGCRGDSTVCDTTTDFKKMMRVFWTKSSDGSVNKGKYYMDQSVMNGMTGARLNAAKWDMGTAATTRSTELRQMCTSAYCNPATNYYAYHHVSGNKIHSEFISTKPGATTGMESRFAAAFDLEANTAATDADFINITSPRAAGAAAKNDAIVYNHCLSRTPTSDGEDFDYTSTGDCSTMPTVNYPNISINDINAWTTADLNDGALFGTMTTNPANINL